MDKKFFIKADQKTEKGLDMASAHTNRKDENSRNRILPHIKPGKQLFFFPRAKKKFVMRGAKQINFLKLCKTAVEFVGAKPPRRRKNGDPIWGTHYLFQFSVLELIEAAEAKGYSYRMTLWKRNIWEEYQKLGHEAAWEKNIFSKSCQREINWYCASDGAYHKGFDEYYDLVQKMDYLNYFDEIGRDPNHPIIQGALKTAYEILKGVYPEDVFHSRSIRCGWIDLDERGLMKIEFMVCPMAKCKRGGYQVTTSRATTLLTKKYNLHYTKRRKALILEAASVLTKKGYSYDPEPYFGKSIQQDIEVAALIKNRYAEMQAKLSNILDDINNVKPDEDLKLLSELQNHIDLIMNACAPKIEVYPNLKKARDVIMEDIALLERRGKEREYWITYHDAPPQWHFDKEKKQKEEKVCTSNLHKTPLQRLVADNLKKTSGLTHKVSISVPKLKESHKPTETLEKSLVGGHKDLTAQPVAGKNSMDVRYNSNFSPKPQDTKEDCQVEEKLKVQHKEHDNIRPNMPVNPPLGFRGSNQARIDLENNPNKYLPAKEMPKRKPSVSFPSP